jgi:hypothetical protein
VHVAVGAVNTCIACCCARPLPSRGRPTYISRGGLSLRISIIRVVVGLCCQVMCACNGKNEKMPSRSGWVVEPIRSFFSCNLLDHRSTCYTTLSGDL